jgi:hypothetical protein
MEPVRFRLPRIDPPLTVTFVPPLPLGTVPAVAMSYVVRVASEEFDDVCFATAHTPTCTFERVAPVILAE